MSGCYLPYELIRGPVSCKVKRIDGGGQWTDGKSEHQGVEIVTLLFFPWWLKAILSTTLIIAAAYGVFCLTKSETAERLEITGMLAIFMFIVTLVAYSDTDHTQFRMESGRKIFVSKGVFSENRTVCLCRMLSR